MRKYLLPKEGNFYKANLHCHTTVSDGKLTPAEVKDAYKAHGYSIVAYTDHCLMIPHHEELSDETFLALNGVELDAGEDKPMKIKKTCHICCIALDPANHTQVCYHREKYDFKKMAPLRDTVEIDESLPDFERAHDPEHVTPMMQEARAKGFFVTYNHPTWSMESFEDYGRYEGMHAMEMYNGICVVKGHAEHNGHVYDALLRQGKRIYCIGADDNHNGVPIGSAGSESFVAFTVIKAETLEYTAVTDALVSGNFYA